MSVPPDPGPAVQRHRDPDFDKDAHRGWFPDDAEAHRRDAPKFCPQCAARLALSEGGTGLATEYWQAGDRIFVCVCGTCGWSGDIVLAGRVIGHEPDDGDQPGATPPG